MSNKPTKRVIAEWEEQTMIQITFPHQNTDWKENLEEVVECFQAIAQEVIKEQVLLVVCEDIDFAKKSLAHLPQEHIIYRQVPNNDTWARDHAPISFFKNGKYQLLDFQFNGWGLKFPADKDNQITQSLFEQNTFSKKIEYKNHLDFVLEGGSIESDGEGTILTTKQCLLSANRNNLSKKKMEQKLRKYLGAKRILWLKNGALQGDDTDSHIDTLARFCDKNTIAYVQCKDKHDTHFQQLQQMEDELKTFRTQEGKPYHLIALPLPLPIYDKENNRLPATYANFLIINKAVLLPVYNCETDKIAIEKMQLAFPNREIVPIDCNALIEQHGSLHCVTMQYFDV